MDNNGIRVLQVDGRLRVVIVLSDTETGTSIKDRIPLALEWRDLLLTQQHQGRPVGIAGFLEQLNDLNTRSSDRQSYSDLAARANRDIAGHLYEVVEFERQWQAFVAIAGSTSNLDLIDKRLREHWPTVSPYGRERAYEMLRVLGFGEDRAENEITDAMGKIRQGDPPFGDGYPVSRAQVIRTLQDWRKRKQ